MFLMCVTNQKDYITFKKIILFPRNYLKDDSVVDITVEDPSDNFVR
jgi:hypothetical protein